MKRLLLFLMAVYFLGTQAQGQSALLNLSAKNKDFLKTKIHLSDAQMSDFVGWLGLNTTIYVAEKWVTFNEETHNEFLISKYRDYMNRHKVAASSIASPEPEELAQPTYCENMDFELGNTTYWTVTSGTHPSYGTGCCPTAGGQATIMSGTGTDPVGGFPVVAPGGSYSLRLGNNVTGGQADRISRTFTVTSSNKYFSYDYAVVLQDPGHAFADQPRFKVEMINALGDTIPCAQYDVTAGQGIPGFINVNGTIYKPWSRVLIDLSSYVGQNVTIRFTTYDCGLGGHFGYAYIDASCSNTKPVVSQTVCQSSTPICPPGEYIPVGWSGTGTYSITANGCIIAGPGTYTINTVWYKNSNCIGPDFVYTVVALPTANFSTSTCSSTINFTNTSSGATSYLWNFGDGGTSTATNPSHTYANTGTTYTVTLTATSANGCTNTKTLSVTPRPVPVANFNQPANTCSQTISFTNTSTISSGTMTYSWNFGDATTSTATNPSHTYTNSGTYTVTLTTTSNFGCTNSISKTFTIYPKAVSNFSYIICDSIVKFTDLSTVSSGSITSRSWTFGDGGTSTSQNPVHHYPAPGTYNVTLTTTTNNGCTSSKTIAVTISPTIYYQANGTFEAGTVPEWRGQIGRANPWFASSGTPDLFDKKYTNCGLPDPLPPLVTPCTLPLELPYCVYIPCNHFGYQQHRTNPTASTGRYAGLFHAIGGVPRTAIEDNISTSTVQLDLRLMVEGLEQKLPISLSAGTKYYMELYASKAEKAETEGVIVDNEVNFVVKMSTTAEYGPSIIESNLFDINDTILNYNPAPGDIIYSGKVTDEINWQKFGFYFTPTKNYTHVIIETAHNKDILQHIKEVVQGSVGGLSLSDVNVFQSYMYLDDIKIQRACDLGSSSLVRESDDEDKTTNQTIALASTAEESNPALNTGISDLKVFPNPNQGSFKLDFNLKNQAEPVTIEVFNTIGTKVFTKTETGTITGKNSLFIDLSGQNIPTGTYFIRIITEAGTLGKAVQISAH